MTSQLRGPTLLNGLNYPYLQSVVYTGTWNEAIRGSIRGKSVTKLTSVGSKKYLMGKPS